MDCRSLVEEEAVDVNLRDTWDAVPLYYACLAGQQLHHSCCCDSVVIMCWSCNLEAHSTSVADTADFSEHHKFLTQQSLPMSMTKCCAGHNEVVQYLLEAGAVCNEYTFDGDRCHYAALNLGIRMLLRQFEARPPPLSPLAMSLRGLSSLCENPEVTLTSVCQPCQLL